MTIEQAAEYIQEETDKLDAPISYGTALAIARHLHNQWTGKTSPPRINVAKHCRQRYEGDNWEGYDG